MSDISELIRLVQIENVRVVEATLRAAIRPDDDVGQLEARIGRNARVVQSPDDGVFIIRVDFTFDAHREDEKKDKGAAAIEVAVGFELTYRIPANVSAPADSLDEFANVNGIFNAWPYFREFVHASLARMGHPPFILPVYRLAPPKKSSVSEKQGARERPKRLAKTH